MVYSPQRSCLTRHWNHLDASRLPIASVVWKCTLIEISLRRSGFICSRQESTQAYSCRRWLDVTSYTQGGHAQGEGILLYTHLYRTRSEHFTKRGEMNKRLYLKHDGRCGCSDSKAKCVVPLLQTKKTNYENAFWVSIFHRQE